LEQKAVDILARHRLMAFATLRPDGWPQATMVSFANDGIIIYFIVSRAGQKFANIERDSRVSLTVGGDFHDPASIQGLSIAAHASEVRDPKQREQAVKLLLDRHPGLKKLERPAPGHSAVMRAAPEIITILDYSKGFGHSDILTVGPGGLTDMTPARDDDWGFGTELKPVS
jgi:nitroimidazol reductase NimA-like FMN-containing flavoprotein (pyridoxamine 5'-phosphate oxidase superfamily)